MKQDEQHNEDNFDPYIVNDDFPSEDEFECWDGTKRNFIISCLQFPGAGFQVQTVEKGKNRMGYEFAAHHPTSPYMALGDLRKRIKWEFSKRYISNKVFKNNEKYFPLHDTLEGRITVDENGLLTFVIDGIPISYDKFLGMFETHEGWKFKVSFAELSDEFSNH